MDTTLLSCPRRQGVLEAVASPRAHLYKGRTVFAPCKYNGWGHVHVIPWVHVVPVETAWSFPCCSVLRLFIVWKRPKIESWLQSFPFCFLPCWIPGYWRKALQHTWSLTISIKIARMPSSLFVVWSLTGRPRPDLVGRRNKNDHKKTNPPPPPHTKNISQLLLLTTKKNKDRHLSWCGRRHLATLVSAVI